MGKWTHWAKKGVPGEYLGGKQSADLRRGKDPTDRGFKLKRREKIRQQSQFASSLSGTENRKLGWKSASRCVGTRSAVKKSSGKTPWGRGPEEKSFFSGRARNYWLSSIADDVRGYEPGHQSGRDPVQEKKKEGGRTARGVKKKRSKKPP